MTECVIHHSIRRDGLRLRRGSVYMIVLAASMMVTVIGLASLLAVRVQRRSVVITQDSSEARLYAQSAIELGLYYVSNDPNWRTTWTNGTWISDQSLGNGRFTLEGIDPDDGILNDSETDPLVLTGTGEKGLARQKMQVRIEATVQPLEALNTCLHASGNINIISAMQITVVDASISTNANLDNLGTIDGDADAGSTSGSGTITGVLIVPAENKSMPDTSVISTYIDRATVLPFTGNIDKEVLTPTYNPWGSGDPNGVYVLDTGSQSMSIMNTRIYGTLIIRMGGQTLTIDDSVFFQPYRSDYPTLIVENGLVELQYQSADYGLSEVTNTTNFNPSGAPYLGESDDDQSDEYPNEIQGLVHITGSLKLLLSARVEGTVICEGTVSCEGSSNTIVHDPNLYANPPDGYTFIQQEISSGSYEQVVD